MKARKYNRIIEIWQTSVVSDEYGGSTVSDTFITKSWCSIKTPKDASRLTDIGITDALNSIVVNLRHRNDIMYNVVNQYIKYNGCKYILKSVSDIDLNGIDITIIATKEQKEIIPIIPIVSGTFDNTFDNTFQ